MQSSEIPKDLYHDLDHLCGTWSAEEAARFEENTKYFEQIDTDLSWE